MKTQKTSKLLMIAGATLLGAGAVQMAPSWTLRAVWAQPPVAGGNPYEAKVKAKFDALAAQVNLSAAQKQSIAAILANAFAQGRAVSGDAKLSGAQKQQKLQALRSATRAKIAELLTPAQRAKAQQLFAERRTRAVQTLGEIADELKLTPAQRAEARPIVQDAVAQARGIFHDASLAPPQKRAKLNQLRQSTREKLASVLTPEQMKKLDQMREALQTQIMARARGFAG